LGVDFSAENRFSEEFLFFVNHSIKDWQCRQMWLFVLCQEHGTDIYYQCWLHWQPIKINKVVRLSNFLNNLSFKTPPNLISPRKNVRKK
jgi:hypothetical protein